MNSEPELQQRLKVLERKASREKKARQLAEQQLEKYSLEIYQTNQSLQKSLVYAEKKQSELSFLAEASAQVASSISIKELLVSMIGLTSKFFDAEVGMYLFGDPSQPDAEHFFWYKSEKCHDETELLSYLKSVLPQKKYDSSVNNWLIGEIESEQLTDLRWMVYTHFPLSKGRSVWLVFFSRANRLDEEALFVLDTARGHLQSGITRRLNQIKMLNRTEELQQTIKSLDKAKRQLIQSEKMASLGQLAAGVAHEINNPIGFISSNLEVLGEYICDLNLYKQQLSDLVEKSGTLDLNALQQLNKTADIDYLLEDATDLVKGNIEGVNRVKEIVGGLKTFSHAGEENFVMMSIVDCIQAALKIAWNALKYEHKVENKIPVELPQINGNSGQLQQVFINLFVNAAQAMESGGTLTLTSELSDTYLSIYVSDTGCGMSEETLAKLFTPFFTSKAVGVGTGLGLSVSYSILEAHGVNVEVTSTLGKGSCFILRFPVDAPQRSLQPTS